MQTQTAEFPFASAEDLDMIAETINSEGFPVIIRTNLPRDGRPLQEDGKYRAEVKYGYDEGRGEVIIRLSTLEDDVGPNKWVITKTHSSGASFAPEAVADTVNEIVVDALVILQKL